MVIPELIHAKRPDLRRVVFIRYKTSSRKGKSLVSHNNFADRMALRRRCIIQISALSTFDGKV